MTRFLVALLLFALPVFAQQQDEVVMTTVLVPVVGSVVGANSVLWKTDLELFNDLSTPVDVVLELPTAPDRPVFIVSLAPGESQRYPDVIGQEFGLEQTLSPLLVSTSARRSVTVRATAYGIRGAEPTEPQPIAIQYGNSWYQYRGLDGLSFNDDERTNIGLVNLSDQDALFTLALQRVPGRNLAVSRVVVPAGSMWHLAIQMLFPLITKGTDFRVVVETTNRDTHAYASVIVNASSTARFVQPRVTTP